MTDIQFRWLGGVLCLDFNNTVAWDDTPGVQGEIVPLLQYERLTEYGRLVAWAQTAGALSSAEAERLLIQAGNQPDDARSVLAAAHDLRRTIHVIFLAITRGISPAEDSIARLNHFLTDSLGHRRLEYYDGGVRWRWSGGSTLSMPLWPIILSAAELVTSEQLPRVRACSANPCGFLFLDRSRNGRRRWCDMADCGNRSKARRHYARRHGVIEYNQRTD